MPHPASLIWVSHGELSPDSFFRAGRVIIRLDYSDNPHRNIVESALLYCKAGLIPETRRYLWSEVRRAMDLVFVQAVIERNDLREGSLYFRQDILEHEIEANAGVKQEYDKLNQMHERGYFTRVFLPELRDYSGRVTSTDTYKQHRQWISNFVDFLMQMAKDHPSGTKLVLDHIRKRFRISLIIVGEPRKLALQGQRPYLKRIAKCASMGARTIFLVGFSDAIPDIAKNATKLGIADSSGCESYHASRHTQVRRGWCARLEISEQTAAAALERIPGIEDWPDIETPAESDRGEVS